MSQAGRYIPTSGPGSGTVTSISQGTGITLTPNPITTTGTVALTIPVAISSGGTNNIGAGYNTDGVFYYDGSAFQTTAVGNATFVLTSNGPGLAPTFQAAAGGSGIVTIDGDTGSVTGNTVSIKGGGSATTGPLASGCNFVATSATNLQFEISNINLPPNNSAGTIGYITQNNTSGAFLISAPRASGYNIYVGPNAGAATLYGSIPGPFSGAGIGNSVLGGYSTLMVLESFGGSNTASYNNIIGMNTATALSTGNYNTIINNNPSLLGGISSGSYNILIGYNTGTAFDGSGGESSNIYIQNQGPIAESNTMRLGTSGSGNGQVNTTYIAGINGVNVGSVASVVSISGDHLGSTVITAGTGISVTPSANTITISASGTSNLTYTNVNTTPYVVLSTDEWLGVDCSGGAITIQLPNAPATGRTFYIKDRTGSANIHNITVTTVGGVVNIDGATSYVMNTQYAAIEVLFNGTSYEIG